MAVVEEWPPVVAVTGLVAAATAAEQAVALWAERVRLAAEERLGCPAEDEACLQDAEFGAALERYRAVRAARLAADRALAELGAYARGGGGIR